MTITEFLALPDDGIDRWLVAGEVREWGSSLRDRFHAEILAELSFRLVGWVHFASTPSDLYREVEPHSPGAVLSGNIAVKPEPDVDTLLGLDVAYFPLEILERNHDEFGFVTGLPTLAIEIVGVDESEETTASKLEILVASQISTIWQIDPSRKSIRVIEPLLHLDRTNVSGNIEIEQLEIGRLIINVESLFIGF